MQPYIPCKEVSLAMMNHHINMNSIELNWPVDISALAVILPVTTQNPSIVQNDLESMLRYFPHWILAGTKQEKITQCRTCKVAAVPTAGSIRCPVCSVPIDADGAAWLGHIPALMPANASFEQYRSALATAGFQEVETCGQVYLLVPLRILYPREWPNVQASVQYAPGWLQAIGLPVANASYHLIGRGQACLFAWGQWKAMSIGDLLQQRVINHVHSLLKIASGQSAQRAFIGRVH